MRFWIVTGLLLCACSGETSVAADAGTTASEDAWWNVDAGTTEGGTEDATTSGATGESEDPCVEQCLASGKAEATQEVCEIYCAGKDGGDDKGGDDKGGDDKGGDDKGGGTGADPGACYYACVQAGGTAADCEADCGFSSQECMDACTAKGGTEDECTKACGGGE